MLEKLVMIIINLLIYYLIVKINYIKLLLITMLMFINIKFKALKKNKLYL